jgi:ABC-type nitrate/sulfonate/bicarbonate transport system permease component
LDKEKRRHILFQIAGIIIAFLLWQLLSKMLGPFRLPGPLKIIPKFFTVFYTAPKLAMQGGGSKGIGPHLLYTARMTISGSVIGVAAGVAAGILLGWSKILNRIAGPVLEAIRTIPPLAIVPFFIMWFGPSTTAQLAMLIFYCFIMLVFNTIEAIKNVNPVYAKFAYTLGAKKGRVYRNVILPATIPELIGGVRVIIGVSWGIQIVAELMGSPKGLGQVFSMSVSLQALDIIIPGIMWIALIAFFVDQVFIRFAGVVTKWAPSE